jgi:hypothetical protein
MAKNEIRVVLADAPYIKQIISDFISLVESVTSGDGVQALILAEELQEKYSGDNMSASEAVDKLIAGVESCRVCSLCGLIDYR